VRGPLASAIGYLTVITPLVAPVFCCCSGVGAFAASEGSRDAGAVTVAELSDRERVPSGARVSVDARLVPVGSDPYHGGVAYQVLGADVIAYCGGGCDDRASSGVVVGRICDHDEIFTLLCHEEPELSLFVDETAAERGRDPASYRVLLLDVDGAHWFGVGCNFCAAAGLVLLVLGGLVVVVRDRREGGPRAIRERTWELPMTGTELEGRIAAFRRDSARVALREPGRVVVLQGRDERSARTWGIRTPEEVPRRIELRWLRRPATQTIELQLRAEEDIVWHAKLAPQTTTLVELALDRTVADLEVSLRPPTDGG
jgi:hypothetical protein